MNSYEKILSSIQELNGAMSCAFVDGSSGMVMANIGSGIDMELAAAGNSEVIRTQHKTIDMLMLNDEINDILITTGTQYHVLYPCKAIKDVFIYAVFHREAANLALVRRTLADIEAGLVSLLFDGQKTELQGLNIKSALDAHVAWRDRLRNVINGENKDVPSVEAASSDHDCMLGKWIYETGANLFGDRAEFQNLVKTHATFHKCAGHVLTTFRKDGAEQAAVELTGDFQKASTNVQKDLVRFFSTAG